MINSKSLYEYIESIFNNDRIPDKIGIHITMENDSIWTIKLFEKIDMNVEISVNNVKIGYFEEITKIGKNLYVCTFYKNDENVRKHPLYFEVINCRFEEYHVFTT